MDEIVKKSKTSKITFWQLTTKWRASEWEWGGLPPSPGVRNYTLEPPVDKKGAKKKKKRGRVAPRPVDEIVKKSKISKITFWQLTTKWRASEGGSPPSLPWGQKLHAGSPVVKKVPTKKKEAEERPDLWTK